MSTRQGTRRASRTLAGTLALLVVFALAACSSAAHRPAAQRGTAGGNCTTAVTRMKAAGRPAELPLPDQPVDMAKNKGKSVWFIAVTLSNQFSSDLANGFKAAATAAGLKPVLFDGQSRVNTWNQGVNEAIDQHASGIVLYAINPELVSGPLARAAAAHIPVVDTLNGSPGDPLPAGVQAHATVDYHAAGATIADYVAGTSNCSADIVYFNASIFLAYRDMLDGFKKELAQVCGACRLEDVLDLDPANVPTKMPVLASTAIARHPDARYFVTVWDEMIPYLEPSLRQSGARDLHVISHDGVPRNLTNIRKGTSLQTADVSDPLTPAMGWAVFDQLGRVMSGRPAVVEQLPQQLFVKENLPGDPADAAALFPRYAGYQAKWLKLWDVA
jgi:ABC-type sugar transport system substrate-binding protein